MRTAARRCTCNAQTASIAGIDGIVARTTAISRTTLSSGGPVGAAAGTVACAVEPAGLGCSSSAVVFGVGAGGNIATSATTIAGLARRTLVVGIRVVRQRSAGTKVARDVACLATARACGVAAIAIDTVAGQTLVRGCACRTIVGLERAGCTTAIGVAAAVSIK